MTTNIKSSLGGASGINSGYNTLSPRDVHEHRLTGYNFQNKQSFDASASNFNNSGYGRKFTIPSRQTTTSLRSALRSRAVI